MNPAQETPRKSAIRSYVIRAPRTKKDPKVLSDAHALKRYFSLRDHGISECITLLQKRTIQEAIPCRYSYEKPLFPTLSSFAANETAKQLLWIDIGFGNGDSLAAMASKFPEFLFLGIEVHPLGIHQLLQRIQRESLSNVILICGDALLVLEAIAHHVKAHVLTGYFLDPWPKKRHHKRRLFNETTLQSIAAAMHSGGLLGAATDWQDYADTIRRLINTSDDFSSDFYPYAPRPFWRKATKYEKNALREGRVVRDFIARKAPISKINTRK